MLCRHNSGSDIFIHLSHTIKHVQILRPLEFVKHINIHEHIKYIVQDEI